MIIRPVTARDWRTPALTILLVAAAAGQWIRSPELVATARAIDRAGFAMISRVANRAWEAWVVRK